MFIKTFEDEMSEMNNNFFGRGAEIAELLQFCNDPGAGFTYVRGRRRVGKSWTLKYLQKQIKNCFYFSGAKDEAEVKAKKRLLYAWGDFVDNSLFSLISPSEITWSRIFEQFLKRVVSSNQPLVIVFDEIQWIASSRSGFVGLLKEAWIEWEQTGKYKSNYLWFFE